jgi:hypothetical protein
MIFPLNVLVIAVHRLGDIVQLMSQGSLHRQRKEATKNHNSPHDNHPHQRHHGVMGGKHSHTFTASPPDNGDHKKGRSDEVAGGSEKVRRVFLQSGP